MKKYVFRLETVKRVRQTQEDVAKAALLQANNEVNQAIQAVEDRLAELQAREQTSMGTKGGVESFMKARFYNELSGKAVLSAQASHRAASLEASAKRDLFTEAAKRTRALDRLDIRRREEYRIEAQREEDKEIDDIVTGRHGRGAN